MQRQDLKKAGLKVTLPRMKILEILDTSKTHHMDAESVYQALLKAGEDIGLATVYRVLNQFETAGLVTRHHFKEGGQAVFELVQDSRHDHLVCNNCGYVVEFKSETIDSRLQQIADNMNFHLEDYSLVIRANCTKKNCDKKKD